MIRRTAPDGWFRELSLRWQVASVSSITVLLVSVYFGLYNPTRNAEQATLAKSRDVAGAAAMVALSVGVGLQLEEPSAVAAAFTWARRDSALRFVAVLDSTGRRIAAYDPDRLSLNMEEERLRPDVHEHEGHFVVAAPVRFQDRALGTVVLASSLAPIRVAAEAERRAGLVASAFILLFGIALSLWLASRIARPVVDLRLAAERVATGDYNVVLASHGRGEVGALTVAFGTMVSTIRQQMRDLASQADELSVTRDAALAAAAAKSTFLATMSHEIRTPMNGVMGMLEILRDTPLDDEQRQYADTASQSANCLLQIINDVLEFSRLEAGRLAIESVPFDLRRTVLDVVGMLSPTARTKGLQLRVDYAAGTPSSFRGDAGRVRQVLTNLAANAIKFTSRGQVTIAVSAVVNHSAHARLRIEVSDSGIGLSAESIGRLFQPFTQADVSTTRQYGGTGLGLAISKELVELMGGAIGVESQEGAGSRFWFTLDLPLTEPPQPAVARAYPVVDEDETAEVEAMHR